MAQVEIKVDGSKGVQLDTDQLKTSPDRLLYMKNMTYEKYHVAGAEGGDSSLYTPSEGNEVIAHPGVAFPAGKNICIGTYNSDETQELYAFVWNNASNHFIYRVTALGGNTGQMAVQMVYQNPDLKFHYNPQFYIAEARCALIVRTYFDKVSGTERQLKLLIWTDSLENQGQISVEDSIATNSYSTALAYFDNTYNNYDRSKIIRLGVPPPTECIGISQVIRTDADKYKQNLMLNKMWKWRARHINVFGEVSEYGKISDQYTPIIGSGCVAGASGLPRCVKLQLEAGSPLIDKVELWFKIDNGDWYHYDTIEKYDNNGALPWYQRPVNPAITYDPVTNRIEYQFCADKQYKIGDPKSFRRENYLPHSSNSIAPLDISISLSGNVHGFEPMTDAQAENVDIIMEPPTNTCNQNILRTVTLYAVIINYWNANDGDPLIMCNGLISNTYGNPAGTTNPDFDDPPYAWGVHLPGYAIATSNGAPNDNPTAWGQFFSQNGYAGFPCYAAGTDYLTVGKQIVRDIGNEFDLGIFDFDAPVVSPFPGVILQKFELKMKPGVYCLRLSDSKQPVSYDYKRRSTTVIGLTKMGGLNAADLVSAFAGVTSPDKEIIVDCTNGDVVLNGDNDDCFVITDTVRLVEVDDDINDVGDPDSVTYQGYLYEDEVNDIPLERQNVYSPSGYPAGLYINRYTDHNGFWFTMYQSNAVSGVQPDAYPLRIEVNDCNTTHNHDPLIPDFTSGYVWSTGLCFSEWVNAIFSGAAQFPDGGRVHVRGRMKLCGAGGIGLSFVPLFIKGAHTGTTDANGYYNLIRHNWAGVYAGDNITLVPTNSGGCQLTACDDFCDFTIGIVVVAFPACTGATRNVDIADMTYAISGINIAGLNNGGKYQFCVIGEDWAGRTKAAKTLPKFLFDVPPITETNAFGFASWRFTINPAANFGSDLSSLSIGVSENMNYSDFLTWIIDQVQFVDNTGNTNTVTPTAIRIYYSSNTEYNKHYGFGANTTWQFLSKADENTRSVIGDQVEFIQKGNGQFFDKRVVATVQYDVSGQFFVIPYDQDLDDLKVPAIGEKTIIKLTRPRLQNEEKPFFELCFKIPLVNGVPQILSGNLYPVDAYMISRSIPIPQALDLNNDGIYEETTDNSNQTANPLFGNHIYKFYDDTHNQVDLPQHFGAVFEHHSPSDFWGEKVNSFGRVTVTNPYEKRIYLDTEVLLSKAYADGSNFNGLSYFHEDDSQVFNQEEYGAIVAVLPMMNAVMIIFEYDHIIVGYKQSGLVTGADNVIRAEQKIGKFSPPQTRKSGGFGCQKWDVNTIRKEAGIVYWLDSANAALVKCDYNTAVDVSVVNEYKSYIVSKVSRMQTMRAIGFMVETRPYFIAGIDPKSKKYLLTYFESKYGTALSGGSATYLNLNHGNNIALPDTIGVDLYSGKLSCFWSFVPEYYGFIRGMDSNMITFRMGDGWIHAKNLPTNHINNFFGTQCKKIFQVAFNLGSEKVKRFLATSVYCKEHVFIVDEVETQTGQVSRILASHWKKGEHFYSAPFLCATNTTFQPGDQGALAPKAIFRGDYLSGRWLVAQYMSEDADDAKYCELSAVVAMVMPVEHSNSE